MEMSSPITFRPRRDQRWLIDKVRKMMGVSESELMREIIDDYAKTVSGREKIPVTSSGKPKTP